MSSFKKTQAKVQKTSNNFHLTGSQHTKDCPCDHLQTMKHTLRVLTGTALILSRSKRSKPCSRLMVEGVVRQDMIEDAFI